MRRGQIFISYRRDDAAGYARALYGRLVQHFPTERVFMDVDAIEPGLPFDEAIQRALDQCEVLLVVIGKRWLEAAAGKTPRINDPEDFVRLEIAAALARNIRVIPLLLDGARMPSEADLPEPLRALARRNALEVSNSRFQADTDRLLATIRKALGESDEVVHQNGSEKRRRLRYGVMAGLALVVIAAVAYLYDVFKTPEAPKPGTRSETAGVAVQDLRPAINGVWEAEVTYDWPNANFIEKFDFQGEGDDVYGTASFLGKRRSILEGRIEKDQLRFITRTRELLGGESQNPREVVHRYRGKFLGGEIKFVMQTEGGYSEHVPIEFTAQRRPAPSVQPAN